MPFATLERRLATVSWIYNEQGLYKLARIVLARLVDNILLLGKVIEKSGNSAYLDGCIYYLDSPYITTRLKSRFLTRTYEVEMLYLIKKYLPDNLPVIELGGYIGVVSCLTNRRLVNPNAHVVVEANRHILPILEANKAKNGCKFKILNAAIAYNAGEVIFYLAEPYNESSVDHVTQQSITVPSTTLRAIIDQEEFTRCNLLCDIEGKELELVKNEAESIRKQVEWLIVEVHDYGQTKSKRVRETLEALGFCLVEQFGRSLAYYNSL